ncbi:MAG TPA: DUF4340 domain-containing protein [Bacteroidia bacterium]|jgi:hypothetical protein|nr:DUF4340 domain-containing protein [Bacteroidia bacterium]
MSKKIDNKKLLSILIILVGIYCLSRYISSKRGENTFKPAIIPNIDTNKVGSIYIYGNKRKYPIHLHKESKQWMASWNDITSIAEQGSPRYMISQLRDISPDRLATDDVKQWTNYQVDSTGTRIVVLGVSKDTILDVIVGKFGFMPEQRQGMSYVRINGQKEVYGVVGFLAMNIAQDFDSWRNRKIIFQDFHTYQKLTFTYAGDSSFSVERVKGSIGKWHFEDGKEADSIATFNSLNSISRQNYGNFVNKFDTNNSTPLFTLKVEADPGGIAVIKAYPPPANDTLDKYVITSSMDPGAYFSGYKSGLFNKLFVSKKAFMYSPPAKASAKPAGKPIKVGKK